MTDERILSVSEVLTARCILLDFSLRLLLLIYVELVVLSCSCCLLWLLCLSLFFDQRQLILQKSRCSSLNTRRRSSEQSFLDSFSAINSRKCLATPLASHFRNSRAKLFNVVDRSTCIMRPNKIKSVPLKSYNVPNLVACGSFLACD